jgi:hypothetical protein
LDDAALANAHRVVWGLCAGVYLTVFIGGIQAGGADLEVVGRAIGFTLATGVLGRIAVGLIGRASLPAEQGPSAEALGHVGSLVDLVGSTNVGHQEDTAASA